MKVVRTKYLLDVESMDRALAFYRDTIGLPVLSSSEHFSELDCGGAVLALHEGGDAGQLTPTGLSFEVDDIERACEEIAAGGGRLVHGPFAAGESGLWLADLADTESNAFMFSEQRAH